MLNSIICHFRRSSFCSVITKKNERKFRNDWKLHILCEDNFSSKRNVLGGFSSTKLSYFSFVEKKKPFCVYDVLQYREIYLFEYANKLNRLTGCQNLNIKWTVLYYSSKLLNIFLECKFIMFYLSWSKVMCLWEVFFFFLTYLHDLWPVIKKYRWKS